MHPALTSRKHIGTKLFITIVALSLVFSLKPNLQETGVEMAPRQEP